MIQRNYLYAIIGTAVGITLLVSFSLTAYSSESNNNLSFMPSSTIKTASVDGASALKSDYRGTSPPNIDSFENLNRDSPSGCEGLTGNLTVFLLLVTKSTYFDSAAILDSINNKVGSIEAASCGIHYGATREGQEAYVEVTLTEHNITPDLKEAGYKIGDPIGMRVIVKSAETVKFYIDPAIKKPDGSPLTIEDIVSDYSFGNGATCCGITLADGTDIRGVAVIVVDEAHNSIVADKFHLKL